MLIKCLIKIIEVFDMTLPHFFLKVEEQYFNN